MTVNSSAASPQYFPKIEVRHIVFKPNENSEFKQGYIQEHLEGIDFNNADVYTCGQEVAGNGLIEKVTEQHPTGCNFFVEAFH